MIPPLMLTRRDALKTAALVAVTWPLLASLGRAAEPAAAAMSAVSAAKDPLRLGVTSYSTRTLSLDAPFETMKVLLITNLALF